MFYLGGVGSTSVVTTAVTTATIGIPIAVLIILCVIGSFVDFEDGNGRLGARVVDHDRQQPRARVVDHGPEMTVAERKVFEETRAAQAALPGESEYARVERTKAARLAASQIDRA